MYMSKFMYAYMYSLVPEATISAGKIVEHAVRGLRATSGYQNRYRALIDRHGRLIKKLARAVQFFAPNSHGRQIARSAAVRAPPPAAVARAASNRSRGTSHNL